ncbi:MAG: M67 family metallopeptidase [Sandarakinorhabdus sp.]|nr:M67 family metallopeptidase [Sandarakinorhabdus sp.]
MVAIASGLLQSLVDAAARAAPHEACGLLLGQPGRIDAMVPADNVAAHPDRSFEIDPATLLRTHREARGRGQRVVGHYHSHPNGVGEPSLRDAAAAIENDQIWLVIAAGAVSGWRVVANDPGESALHGRFFPVMLETAA